MDLSDLIREAATWLAAGFTGLLAWTAKRHLDEDKERHGKASDRLAGLERGRVTVSDLAALERQMSQLRSDVADNHAEILKLLLDQNSRA